MRSSLERICSFHGEERREQLVKVEHAGVARCSQEQL